MNNDLGKYRKVDTATLENIQSCFSHNSEFVSEYDFKQIIDEIENEVNSILNLLKEYDLKDAMDKLEELSNKLY